MVANVILTVVFILFALTFVNSIMYHFKFNEENRNSEKSRYRLIKLDQKRSTHTLLASLFFTLFLAIAFLTQN